MDKRIRRVKMIMLTLMLLLISSSIYATPDPATWTRKIFIGHDENFYYCLSIERQYPRSYHEYTDFAFFSKYSNNGTLTEKILLREIEHFQEDANPPWLHKEQIKDPMNLESLLIKNNLFYDFPSDELNGYNISFEEKGIFIEGGKKKVLLINANDLGDYINYYENEVGWNMKLVEYYEGEGYFYFITQYGLSWGDTDFCQTIIPISSSIIRKAEETLRINTDSH